MIELERLHCAINKYKMKQYSEKEFHVYQGKDGGHVLETSSEFGVINSLPTLSKDLNTSGLLRTLTGTMETITN